MRNAFIAIAAVAALGAIVALLTGGPSEPAAPRAGNGDAGVQAALGELSEDGKRPVMNKKGERARISTPQEHLQRTQRARNAARPVQVNRDNVVTEQEGATPDPAAAAPAEAAPAPADP